MINKQTLTEKARANWLRASHELGFRIITPFIFYANGKQNSSFAYLPDFGSKKGIVIDLIYPPDFITNDAVENWANKNNCYFSFINVEICLNYKKEIFGDILSDWDQFNSNFC